MKMTKYLVALLALITAFPAQAQIRSCASLTTIAPITGSECMVAYTGAGLMGKTTPNALFSSFDTDDLVEGTTNLYFTNERVDDRAAALIQNGTGISWSYNDAGGTLTPTISLSPFSTSDLSEGSNLYFTDERGQDSVGGILVDSATIDFTYSDATPSITASVIASAIDHGGLAGLADDDHTQYHTDARALTWLGTRSTTDLAEGTRLYFTDERAQDATGAMATDGSLVYVDATPLLTRGALTGDITAAQGSNATTLATVNANVGTFGNATQVAQVTLDGKGRATGAANITITPAASSITGGQALTKADDTNVTLTLGGTPTTALLQPASITAGWTGQLAVSRGGSGAGTLTGLLQGNGTSPFTAITNSSTVGQCLRVTGASTYAWGAVDLANASAVTGRLGFANLTQGTARSVLGVTGNATANVASIQGTADQVLRVNSGGTALAFGQVNLASANAVTGDLPFANIAQLSANSVLANPTVGTADAQALSVAANSIVGRVTGGNVDDIPVGFGLTFDASSLRFNLASTKVDWTGDHTWRDNNFRLYNPAGTFLYNFRTSAIAAQRDVTLPLLTGNDTFVFEGHTQTLTNKTLTSPAINTATIEGGTIGNTTPATIAKVDNLQLDGNTLSSLDTNGNILIRPNGTGGVRLGASATDYWNFASDGTMSPVNPTNVAPFKLGVDMYAFNVPGTFAGLFFRFAGTFLPGVAGYVFPDLVGGDIASADVAGFESFMNAVYGIAIGQSDPAAISANTNDWNLLGTAPGSVRRICATTPVDVTGIVAPTYNRTVLLVLDNICANAITLKHLTTSAAANQFRNDNAGNVVVQPQGTAGSRRMLYYDQSDDKWHNIN